MIGFLRKKVHDAVDLLTHGMKFIHMKKKKKEDLQQQQKREEKKSYPADVIVFSCSKDMHDCKIANCPHVGGRINEFILLQTRIIPSLKK